MESSGFKVNMKKDGVVAVLFIAIKKRDHSGLSSIATAIHLRLLK
jgi:hypothetical protein